MCGLSTGARDPSHVADTRPVAQSRLPRPRSPNAEPPLAERARARARAHRSRSQPQAAPAGPDPSASCTSTCWPVSAPAEARLCLPRIRPAHLPTSLPNLHRRALILFLENKQRAPDPHPTASPAGLGQAHAVAAHTSRSGPAAVLTRHSHYSSFSAPSAKRGHVASATSVSPAAGTCPVGRGLSSDY